MDNKTEYFKCDCVYHRKGYILCNNCIEWINEDNKNDDGFIKVKRWKNNKTETNKPPITGYVINNYGRCNKKLQPP